MSSHDDKHPSESSVNIYQQTASLTDKYELNMHVYRVKLRSTGMIGCDFFRTVSSLSLLLIPVCSIYQVLYSLELYSQNDTALKS